MRSAAKLLRFPLGGLAKNGSYRDTTYPTDESVYSTPTALNVIGECAFSSRLRGGSRPGLKPLSGTQTETSAYWLWPNGDRIAFVDDYGDWSLTFSHEGYFVSLGPMYEGNNIWHCVVEDTDGTVREDFDATGSEGATFLTFRNSGSLSHVTLTGSRTRLTGRFIFPVIPASTLPDGASLVAQHPTPTIYRDRLLKADGAVWMASRTGDYGNFDFGGEADDVTKACAGTLADAGFKGEPITAFANFADSRLFIATTRRLVAITGEPTSAVTTISTNVGIVSANAWCNADGILYFVGPNGLYVVGDGAPTNVSQQIPDDLKGLSSALLVYDPHYRGIHLFTSRADYFYDIDNRAFWPVAYPVAKRPTEGYTGVVANVNVAVFKCADGAFRYWDETQTTDDGTPIESRVAIGPFKCGVNEGDGMLDEIDVTLANGSSQVNLAVQTAHTAESAASSPDANAPTFAFTTGYNPPLRTRHRGAWATLTLSAVGRWAYESIYARIKTLGRLRP